MKKWVPCTIICLQTLLTSCTPVQTPIHNQYKLTCYNNKFVAKQTTSKSLLLSQPEAVDGYQTSQMLYSTKPYEIQSFAHSSWVSAPAKMIFPLMVVSLQRLHYFSAIASSAYANKTDYRLDTQLIELQQNFLTHPSTLDLTIKTVLSKTDSGRTLASKIFIYHIPCTTDTPYGGVMAANKAASLFTRELSQFVMIKIQQDT